MLKNDSKSAMRQLLDVLGGAACLLLWGALWSLLISALVHF
jgi:hypothetical protein